jgi:AcrR family transcriptional regulator
MTRAFADTEMPADTGDGHADPEAAPLADRILRAAFEAFMENGFAGTSTLEIATRAKVSKRDLYAHFGSKQAMLVACIKRRTARMRPAVLPLPRSRAMLAATLTAFARQLMREVSDPVVVATMRLAVAEATRSPEIAQAIDGSGRAVTRDVLANLVVRAQEAGFLGAGEPSAMATQYVALLWENLMMSLLLGLAETPSAAEIERRAERATAALLALYPAPKRQATTARKT